MKAFSFLIFLFSLYFSVSHAQTVVAPDCSDAVDNNICTDASFQIDPNGAGLQELNEIFLIQVRTQGLEMQAVCSPVKLTAPG